MFPLTGLSILFTALLIIVFLCLGLIVLLGILICRRFNWNHPPTAPTTNTTPVSQQSLPPDQFREVTLGTSIAIWGLAFAFAVYASDVIKNSNLLLEGIAVYILAFVMLYLGFAGNRRPDNIRRIRRWLYPLIVIIVIVILVSFCMR